MLDPESNIYEAKVKKGEAFQAALAYQNEKLVERVSANKIYRPSSFPKTDPDDPYYHSENSWRKPYKKYDDLWGVKQIKAKSAWQNNILGQNIIVAVIDTGVDYTHPDIKHNIWINKGETGKDKWGRDKRSNGIDDDHNGYIDDWRGYNFNEWPSYYETKLLRRIKEGEPTGGFNEKDVKDDLGPNNNPMDYYGHGTHVAGIIAAEANNKEGIVGVAPKAKIMAIKAGGEYFSTSSLIKAFKYAFKNGAQIINCSWGGFGEDPILESFIKKAVHQYKITVVVAAGNSSDNVLFFNPAATKEVITVGASTPDKDYSFFTNKGAKIDIVAPGAGIGEEDVYGILSLRSLHLPYPIWEEYSQKDLIVGRKYLRLAGTSMAAPFVSGAVALLKSAYPDLTPQQIKNILTASASDIVKKGWDKFSGWGLLNIQQSFRMVPILRKHQGVFISQPNNNAKILLDATKRLIQGTVDIKDLRSYEVAIKKTDLIISSPSRFHTKGFGGSNWVVVYSSGDKNKPQPHFGVSAFWVVTQIGTHKLSEGNYLIRLSAQTKSGQKINDLVLAHFDLIAINSPAPFSTLKINPQKSFVVKATSMVAPRERYILEIRNVSKNGEWQKLPLYEKFRYRANEMFQNTGIGSINPNILEPGCEYQIRLTVYSKSTKYTKINTFYTAPIKTIHSLPESTIIGQKVADLNGDGKKEQILIYHHFRFGDQITVLDEEGKTMPGWPKSLPAQYFFDPLLTQNGSIPIHIFGSPKNRSFAFPVAWHRLLYGIDYVMIMATSLKDPLHELWIDKPSHLFNWRFATFDFSNDQKIETIYTYFDNYNRYIELFVTREDGATPYNLRKPYVRLSLRNDLGSEPEILLSPYRLGNGKEGLLIISNQYNEKSQSEIINLSIPSFKVKWRKSLPYYYLSLPRIITYQNKDYLAVAQPLGMTKSILNIFDLSNGKLVKKTKLNGVLFGIEEISSAQNPLLLIDTLEIESAKEKITLLDPAKKWQVASRAYSLGYVYDVKLHALPNLLIVKSLETNLNSKIYLFKISKKTFHGGLFRLMTSRLTFESLEDWPREYSSMLSLWPTPFGDLPVPSLFDITQSWGGRKIKMTTTIYQDFAFDWWWSPQWAKARIISLEVDLRSKISLPQPVDSWIKVYYRGKDSKQHNLFDVVVKLQNNKRMPEPNRNLVLKISGADNKGRVLTILNPTNEKGYGWFLVDMPSVKVKGPRSFELRLFLDNRMLKETKVTNL